MVKKRKQNRNQGTGKVSNVVSAVHEKTFEGLTKEELVQVIAEALLRYDEQKSKKRDNEGKEQQERFNKLVGYKDHSSESFLKKILFSFGNQIKVFFNILFMKKKQIEGTRATSSLIKMFTYCVFFLANLSLTLFSLFLIACVPIQYCVSTITPLPWYSNVLLIIAAFISFVFARLFRMASIEVEKLQDYNFIFGIFACVTSIISLAIAIIAILK